MNQEQEHNAEAARRRLEIEATDLLAREGFRRDGRPTNEDPVHIVDAMNFAGDQPTAKDAIHVHGWEF